jgi:hypothetical protein
MAYTGKLGVTDSRLGNIELGRVAAAAGGPEKYAFGQAQALIANATGFGYGQAQAFIDKAEGFGQAQAWIKQTYYGHGQAQADIKTTYYGLGQAQATLIVKAFVFGQAQGKIKVLGATAFGQAQGAMATPGWAFAWAQASIFRDPTPRPIIPVNVMVYKNGLRNTSRYSIGNAAWEMMPDGKRILWRADFDDEDILIVEKENDSA